MAIAIPVFTSQLEKSKEATDKANLRSAYGQAVADYLDDGNAATSITIGSCTFDVAVDNDGKVTVTMKSGGQSKKYKTASYSGGAFPDETADSGE